MLCGVKINTSAVPWFSCRKSDSLLISAEQLCRTVMFVQTLQWVSIVCTALVNLCFMWPRGCICKVNKTGPNTEPSGTPQVRGTSDESQKLFFHLLYLSLMKWMKIKNLCLPLLIYRTASSVLSAPWSKPYCPLRRFCFFFLTETVLDIYVCFAILYFCFMNIKLSDCKKKK